MNDSFFFFTINIIFILVEFVLEYMAFHSKVAMEDWLA